MATADDVCKRAALRMLRGQLPVIMLTAPLLMTVKDAAKYLGVSRGTFDRLIQRKLIERVELYPGSFRVRRSDVETLVWYRQKGGPS